MNAQISFIVRFLLSFLPYRHIFLLLLHHFLLGIYTWFTLGQHPDTAMANKQLYC
jgi:hypothetical protein